VCDTENFTLTDAQDYAICEFWQKDVEKRDNLQFKNVFLMVMFGGICIP
jgi:hypothetical protein